MGFSWQEYWSRLPHPFPGVLPNPRIESESLVAPTLQADSLLLTHQGSPVPNIRNANSSDPIPKVFIPEQQDEK